MRKQNKILGAAILGTGNDEVIHVNTWSVAGDTSRPKVNKMALQPSVQYNLPKNWYLTTEPEIDANWNAARGNVWFVPVGGGMGKVFTIGRQSLAGTVLVYRNGTPAATIPSPKWQVIGALTFLCFQEESQKAAESSTTRYQEISRFVGQEES